MEQEGKPETVWRYYVIALDCTNAMLHTFTIHTNDLANLKTTSSNNKVNSAIHIITGNIDPRNIRTREQFVAALGKVIESALKPLSIVFSMLDQQE